jgi:hypothetical protein
MKLELKLLLVSILALILSACDAGAQDLVKPVGVEWDPPVPAEVELVDGYNVYEVTITPKILPERYSVNLVSPLSPEFTVEYRKLNTELIPKGTFKFTIVDARPGFQTIVRAYSATWDVKSPDSDILTLRPLPRAPAGLKAVSLIIEQSSNMKSWAPLAAIEVAADLTASFFRLAIQ